MKKYSLIAILLIAVMMIAGCSHNAEVSKNADESESVSFSAENTENNDSKIVTEDESSTQSSTTETTTAQTTNQPKEKSTTLKTTAAQTHTTTQAETATKKQTTTKKVTTTEEEWDRLLYQRLLLMNCLPQIQQPFMTMRTINCW